MVERLTDDALDVVVDIVMVTMKRLPRRPVRTRGYWIGITRDWWHEWCDRRSYEYGDWEDDNAPLKA